MRNTMGEPGRPRNQETSAAIVAATAELVVERGYAQVTVDEIVRRAGTTKPAFYRRFGGLADVVPVILVTRHGTDEDIDTGTLVGDLLEVQARQVALFSDPVVVRGVAGWLAAIDDDPSRSERFRSGYLGPRRAFTSVILGRAVDRGEIAPGADPAWIADLLTGPLLMRAVLQGIGPVDEVLGRRTVAAALDALGYRGDRASLSPSP